MRNIQNFALGSWVDGKGEGQMLKNAINGAEIGRASSNGLDFAEMIHYARTIGNRNLRKLTFHERGRMLKALALHLTSEKDSFYKISWATGATKIDSWIDIEGGIGNLFAYSSLRRQFPNLPYCIEGDPIGLSKGGTFMGHHLCVPKEGVAIHINAFNFPVWGMLEKIAVNLLAGMPAIVKPATVTCYLTEAVVKSIINANILPEGALQLICGSANGIIDHVNSTDVVTFTGSASTGMKLKSHPKIIAESVPFNLEADSLNCCVLGMDAVPGTPEFDIFIKEIQKEMTIKAGQKCTAVRRIIVPENLIEPVQSALIKRLSSVVVGDPAEEGVRMGSLASLDQLDEVRNKVSLLEKSQQIVFGNPNQIETSGKHTDKGAFISPILFFNEKPFTNTDCHDIEAFGPVSTLMPYKNLDEAISLAKMGKGSLVSSIVTANHPTAKDFVVSAATMHGRILVLNEECAKESTGHGSPMPMLTHGGPGRAGGGEEMGGKRGVFHYLQRTAIQGSPTTIGYITEVYQQHGKQTETDIHPFRRHFEELNIGETVVTHKHTVTETDITNFANVSGDNFYAHMDATSLEGTIFTQRVAHGYFVLSKAAGLFVDAKKGPVLLNYGIEEARFTKPVYPGMTIGVKLTVKEKIDTEKRTPEDIAKGIVKWLVDVYDETGETVAIATILTMVKKINQD